MEETIQYLFTVKTIYNTIINDLELSKYRFPLVTTTFGSNGQIMLQNGIQLSLSILVDCYSLPNNIIIYKTRLFYQDSPFKSRFTTNINRFITITKLVEFIEIISNMTIDDFTLDVESESVDFE